MMWPAWSTSANLPPSVSSTTRIRSCMGCFWRRSPDACGTPGRCPRSSRQAALVGPTVAGSSSTVLCPSRVWPEWTQRPVTATSPSIAEFTAKSITAFFSLDLAQLRGYGLGDDAWKLLVALSLWKVRRFLDSNMRLRTACELELLDGDKPIHAKRPDGFTLPSAKDLAEAIGDLIKKCKPLFAQPAITELTWNKP